MQIDSMSIDSSWRDIGVKRIVQAEVIELNSILILFIKVTICLDVMPNRFNVLAVILEPKESPSVGLLDYLQWEIDQLRSGVRFGELR